MRAARLAHVSVGMLQAPKPKPKRTKEEIEAGVWRTCLARPCVVVIRVLQRRKPPRMRRKRLGCVSAGGVGCLLLPSLSPPARACVQWK